MHNFDFVKPSSIADAVKALSNEGAQALSGGQTLTPTMKQRLAAPTVLVSLTGIAEMKGVCMGSDGLSIGAATPHATVAKEALAQYPALAHLAGGIGDPAVRNRGTIGGSLASALADATTREASLITFLAAAANITMLGIGGAFWGLVIGLIAYAILNGRLPQRGRAPQQAILPVSEPATSNGAAS